MFKYIQNGGADCEKSACKCVVWSCMGVVGNVIGKRVGSMMALHLSLP